MTNRPIDAEVVQSEGNIYADLGFEAPAIELAKAELAHAISRIIDAHGWTQEEAARQMGIDQPKVSAIMRGRLAGFSVERMLRLLNLLNYQIILTVTPVDANGAAGIGVRFLDPVAH